MDQKSFNLNLLWPTRRDRSRACYKLKKNCRDAFPNCKIWFGINELRCVKKVLLDPSILELSNNCLPNFGILYRKSSINSTYSLFISGNKNFSNENRMFNFLSHIFQGYPFWWESCHSFYDMILWVESDWTQQKGQKLADFRHIKPENRFQPVKLSLKLKDGWAPDKIPASSSSLVTPSLKATTSLQTSCSKKPRILCTDE